MSTTSSLSASMTDGTIQPSVVSPATRSVGVDDPKEEEPQQQDPSSPEMTSLTSSATSIVAMEARTNIINALCTNEWSDEEVEEVVRSVPLGTTSPLSPHHDDMEHHTRDLSDEEEPTTRGVNNYGVSPTSPTADRNPVGSIYAELLREAQKQQQPVMQKGLVGVGYGVVVNSNSDDSDDDKSYSETEFADEFDPTEVPPVEKSSKKNKKDDDEKNHIAFPLHSASFMKRQQRQQQHDEKKKKNEKVGEYHHQESINPPSDATLTALTSSRLSMMPGAVRMTPSLTVEEKLQDEEDADDSEQVSSSSILTETTPSSSTHPSHPWLTSDVPISTAIVVDEEEQKSNSSGDNNIVKAEAVPEDQGCQKILKNRIVWILVALALLVGIVVVIVLLTTNGSNDDEPTASSPSPTTTTDTADASGTSIKKGFANSFRFWDCSGGACGCSHIANTNDDPDKPTYCHGNAMFLAPPTNIYGATFYGTAAVSKALGGDWWLGDACGKCWKLVGTSNVGTTTTRTTTIVVKGTNFCAPEKCGEEDAAFSIAAPGFDSDPSTRYEVCDEREAGQDYNAHATACIDWMTGNATDPSKGCNCDMFRKDDVLREGCKNFLSMGWDDPVVEYEELEECPMELEQLPCWEQNGENYPIGIPDLCANPNAFQS